MKNYKHQETIQMCACAPAHQNPSNITYPSETHKRSLCNNRVVSVYVVPYCQAQYLPDIPTIFGCILAAQLFLCLILMRNNRLAAFLPIKSLKYIFTLIPSKTQGEIACFLKTAVLFGRYQPYNLFLGPCLRGLGSLQGYMQSLTRVQQGVGTFVRFTTNQFYDRKFACTTK